MIHKSTKIACSVMTLLLSCIAVPNLHAQGAYNPSAPKPLQLTTAKSVFISNNTAAPLANSDKVFDEIYAGVKQLNRFTVLASPEAADLILEFSLITTGDNDQFVTLRILDGKTRIVLWSVSDSGQTKAIYGSNGKKNQHDVLDNIFDYLQIITTPKQTN
ncbi:hypothetical protein AciX9_2761 [Granulicella tundricola MP5ACTX9]|uniref:DUF4174 domain-containing protein n=1 Tax=Granulicella tundricola (strain ATCC BAA-1859 / DSM 23138 / MP5ACTX9) TaxID=1198114 RepID=E8WXU0_GRATM|nr:hypothetical protein AciX9_2761 [Granulicella tundricola MP5ACTX9]